MTLPPIESVSRVADQVFEALLTAVVSGELAQGQRLRIRDLAAELGTSEMPVRDAIRRLEEAGLAESAPYRGAAVKQFTRQELLNVYAVRRILEVEAARAGAAAMDDAAVRRVEAELEQLIRALEERRSGDYLDHDEQLLLHVYEASGNPVLVETIRSLWLKCRSFKLVGAKRELDSGSPETLSSYQRDLLEAVRRHDPRAAARVTGESIDSATARIHSVLDH